MTIYERRQKIIKHLRENHFAQISELAKLVWSSESSVRRDIKALEQKGFVNQIYGGVVLAEYSGGVVPVTLRDSSHSAVKEKLAKEASRYIKNGDTVFMDGSSTVRRIVKYIGDLSNIKLITNNHSIFSECNHPGIKLYSTGGKFVSQSNIFVGSSAESYINQINADIFFFSSQALSDDGEISDVSEEETALRKAMLCRSQKKIFLCDSSKLGLKKMFTLCTKDDIDTILCDKELPWE